ncbi:MAG: ComEA family DNA-binding protein [Chloroflexi bacterium]|nr:ComEA family DNA-binding protein [Chloroflexota bacterium]
MVPSEDEAGITAHDPGGPKKVAGWRRAAEAAAFFVLAALIVAGGLMLWQRHTASQPLEIALAEAPGAGQVSVYVSGAVNRPGIYSVDSGKLVTDALRAAGGITADADLGALDLRQRLRDSGQLYVPRQGESPQRININNAAAWLLETLPGIGEKTAQKIIEYRVQNGLFQRLEDLRDLKLVSASTFDRIRDRITVGP